VAVNICEGLEQTGFITNIPAIPVLVTASSMPNPKGLPSGWSSI